MVGPSGVLAPAGSQSRRFHPRVRASHPGEPRAPSPKPARHVRAFKHFAHSLASVGTGDIVPVERTGGHPARLIVLRSAADELASPE
jgi:hypothetical protein